MQVSLGEAKILSKYPSGKAFRVSVEEHGILNIPVDAITEDSEVWKVGDEGELVVDEWYAEQNNLT